MRKDIDQMALVEDDFNFNVSDMEKVFYFWNILEI